MAKSLVKAMKPLSLIYWSRVVLGVIAALFCVFLNILSPETMVGFFTGLTTAMLFYIVTYYVYKWRFIAMVEKPQKIFTTGIFAYFLTWIVAWTLFYTPFFIATRTPQAMFTYLPETPLIGENVTFNASDSIPNSGTIVNYAWDFGDGNLTATNSTSITHAYVAPGDFAVTLKITDSEGLSNSVSKIITIHASLEAFRKIISSCADCARRRQPQHIRV